MSDFANEFENELNKKKLPTGINVLTILTFIGNGLGVFSAIWNYYKSEKSLADLEAMANKPDFNKMPDFVKKMASPEAIEMVQKMVANKLPVLIINIIGCTLCVYGAIEMRKLKISGFYTYLLGSILPFIAMFIIIGASFFNGFGVYFGIGITVLFILLYSFQVKYLTNK
jgi:hypothetical protein